MKEVQNSVHTKSKNVRQVSVLCMKETTAQVAVHPLRVHKNSSRRHKNSPERK